MNTMALAVLCAALAGFGAPRSESPARVRLRLLAPGADRGGQRAVPVRGRSVLMRRAVAALAGMTCAVMVGGPAGWVLGIGVAIAGDRSLAALEPAEVRARRARLTADLPIAVDLLAACLRGGTGWGEAVQAVAEAIDGPLSDALRSVAAQIRLGADPAQAWLTLTGEPVLAPLARTVARAVDSGTSLSPVLSRLARDRRRAASSAAAARARSAGVRAVAPLGLCFLPAFVLLGIVPAVVGIAATLRLP